MTRNLMRIRLSESQRLWLRALCSKLRTGEQVSARALKVELRDKLAEDFDPSKIDTRLLADEDQITLLGITLFDPTNEAVKKADLVIRSIHDLLIRFPETKSIGADFISQETHLPKQEVAVILKRLSRLAYFHDYGTKYGYGIDGLLTIRIDKRTFDAYLKYTNLKSLLDTLTDDQTDLVNRASEERVQEVLQHIRNLQSGLTNIWVKAIDGQDLNGAIEDLQRWKVQATQFLRDNISEVEGRELQKITQKYPLIRNAGDLDFRISKYEEKLKGLAKEIQDDPTLLSLATETASHETSIEGDSGKRINEKEDPTVAIQLYEKVKNLIQNSHALDESKARIVVESADDAIKEFGSTNQEKKVELRKWKTQAELVLPPSTIEELRKRAEGQVLQKVYPKPRVLRSILLWAVGIGVIATILFSLISRFSQRESKHLAPTETAAPINSDRSKSNASTEASPVPPASVEVKPDLKIVDVFMADSKTLEVKLKNSGNDSAFLKSIQFVFDSGTKGCADCDPEQAVVYSVEARVRNERITIEPKYVDKTTGRSLTPPPDLQERNDFLEKARPVIQASHPLKISEVVPPRGVARFQVRFNISRNLISGKDIYYIFSAHAIVLFDDDGRIKTPSFEIKF